MLMSASPRVPCTTVYLLCKDDLPKCSLDVCKEDDRLAAGSLSGGVTVWDATTGLAKHHVRHGVRASLPCRRYACRHSICAFLLAVGYAPRCPAGALPAGTRSALLCFGV